MITNKKNQTNYFICTYFPHEQPEVDTIIGSLFSTESAGDVLKQIYDALKPDWICGQWELCPTTKRYHLQFVLHFVL